VPQVGAEEGPVNLKGSVKSDEAFSLSHGVWIAYGTAANVVTASEMRLAYIVPRLV
jgi:hypothetical protein